MASIKPLAALTPAANARTWHSTPHPHLPIVATACSDKSVRMYSLRSFQQESKVDGGHKRSIRSCAWKPNSKGESVLATGSFDASAGIWRRWEEGAIDKAEVDFTGSGLAGGAEAADEDEEEWRFAVILDGHDSEIKSLGFSPVAPLLATCSRDKSVWIWEELEDDNFETVAVLQEHEGDVKCIAWHPEEQMLASGSYDDNIRLWREDVDDWACCTLLTGHGGTVWWVEFEGGQRQGALRKEALDAEKQALLEQREKAGPRLVSCSDDLTIRIWRRVPKEKPPPPPTGQGRMPTIFKNNDFEEEWVEEARLPKAHERAVYAVSWSRRTGKLVSCGSDGKIIVYSEQWRRGEANESTSATNEMTDVQAQQSLTHWVVESEIMDAHGVFEINHVTWADRADKGKQFEGEEIIVSTGDDGEVKVWTV
ncbi:cytosolic iron-sulfur protein assembly protein 1 [Polychaeton citri CBS 116435]|uniref:Probable cytosolic iron-sulfur protein assembly protein 1 n=1 Tax=Polychaeton citri CBS 116435 TaxID=1314669 RepID=A0A9P4PXR2_9PEZI|nr:cytosolic iron-sulfur protein assembly protein 1 [Polychaeton citri CBS 116435]